MITVRMAFFKNNKIWTPSHFPGKTCAIFRAVNLRNVLAAHPT